MAKNSHEDFFPEARNPESTRAINGRCLIRTHDEHRVVTVSGIIMAHYAVTDRMAEAQAMVNLVEQGWATQIEVGSAFSQSERTVRRVTSASVRGPENRGSQPSTPLGFLTQLLSGVVADLG